MMKQNNNLLLISNKTLEDKEDSQVKLQIQHQVQKNQQVVFRQRRNLNFA
jgi:hypothetical protein